MEYKWITWQLHDNYMKITCLFHLNMMISVFKLQCPSSFFYIIIACHLLFHGIKFDTVFFVFFVHSQSDQCSWENPLQTSHLDGCCLSSCIWSRIHVGWTRGQFQRGEEHWADDGMQWLPVWGMESADIQNTHWEMARQIRGGDSHCSNRPYPGQAGRGLNVGRPWGLPHLLLSSKPLSETINYVSS